MSAARDTSATLRTFSGAKVRDASGLRTAKNLYARSGGILRTVFSSFSDSGVTVSPDALSAFGNSRGTAYPVTAAATATVIGGTSPYFYAWSVSGFTATTPTGAVTQFRSPGLAAGDDVSGTAFVTVTDSSAPPQSAVSPTINLYAVNSNPGLV